MSDERRAGESPSSRRGSTAGTAEAPSRRVVLGRGVQLATAAGVVASSGTWLWVIGSFAAGQPDRVTRVFVTELAALADGALSFQTPSGASILVSSPGAGVSPTGLVAMSRRCPHLGCRVRWDEVRQEYHCPCHDGRFDASGRPTAGPPLAAGEPLVCYPVVVEGERVFIELPAEELRARSEEEVARR